VFDPFNDFQTAGYLRNFEALKDPLKISRVEHNSFKVQLEKALDQLRRLSGPLTYGDYLKVHGTLFQDFYPWAGQDRHTLGVGRLVSKGSKVQFEVSELSQQAVEWGLNMGNDPEYMRKWPGEVMGAFAWGHPFLDGNGRSMLLVHTELCYRAGFAIDWIASKKSEYLDAHSHELAHPRDLVLDAYLSNLIVKTRPRTDWVEYFKTMPGLSGDDDEMNLGYAEDDVEAIARYEEVKLQRTLKSTLAKFSDKTSTGSS
jgi:cell filamentation protein